MTQMTQLVIVIAIAALVGQWISKTIFKTTPKEDIAVKTTSGDPVRDFLDQF